MLDRALSTLGQTTGTQHPARMAKMKKGKAHHWHKEEKDKVPKKSYVPSGKPRGRPKKPEGEAKAKYVPTGVPRGRPKKSSE